MVAHSICKVVCCIQLWWNSGKPYVVGHRVVQDIDACLMMIKQLMTWPGIPVQANITHSTTVSKWRNSCAQLCDASSCIQLWWNNGIWYIGTAVSIQLTNCDTVSGGVTVGMGDYAVYANDSNCMLLNVPKAFTLQQRCHSCLDALANLNRCQGSPSHRTAGVSTLWCRAAKHNQHLNSQCLPSWMILE